MTQVQEDTGSGSAVADAKDQVQEKAGEAAEQVKEATGEAREQARDRVRSEVDRRSTEAGQQVGDTAEAMRKVAQTLREDGKDGPARAAEQAAERAERAGSWLKEADADRILSDIEDFGRRKPWAVALGGMALGMAAARFLRASSTERYQRSQKANGGAPSNGRSSTPSLPRSGAAEAQSAPLPGTPPTAPLDPPSSG
jgi:hypothetical protein